MVDFGDELIIESFRIPWLIWIQLVVTILLLVLLFFGFALFTVGASTSSSFAAPPSDGCDAAPSAFVNNSTSSHGIIAVEDERGRVDARSSTNEGEESPAKEDTVLLSISQHPHHPCNYFGLAKNALFKCLGLDSNSQHEKRD